MRTIQVREPGSTAGTTIATALLGAVAGFAVGMYVAQRLGGFGGLARRWRPRTQRDQTDAYYEAVGEDYVTDDTDITDDTDLSDDADDLGEARAAKGGDDRSEAGASTHPELEERVLEAFVNDPVLAERAIDIGAIGPGDIELEGWVDDDAEADHAVTIARGVPGVRSVTNRLMVDEA